MCSLSAPSMCELQYGTMPSLELGESPRPRSPMMVSYGTPGVIGMVLIAFTNRLFGESVSTLLARRFGFSSSSRMPVTRSISSLASLVSVGSRISSRGESSEPAAREIAAAQRRGDEDDAPDFRPMPKEQFLPEILAGVRRERHLIRRASEDFHPKLIAAVGEQQPADAAAHAVADHDHRFHLGKALFHAIEFLAQDRGEVRIRVAARITVEPELVVLPDHRIAAQRVDHRRPGRLRIHQPVNDEHDGLVRIVGLEPLDRRGVREFLRVNRRARLVLLRIGLLEHDRERHGEIRRERKGAAVKGDGLVRERIFELEHAAPALEVRDHGDAVEKSRRREILSRLLVLLALDGDDRRADARRGGALSHVFAADVELVRRREVVERGIPLRTRIGFVGEDEIAVARRAR